MTFRAPPGPGLETLRARFEATEVAGGMVTIRTTEAQDTLGRLLAWADEHRIRLEHLEVRRPDLEEVFLELVGDGADHPATGAGAGDA